MTRYDSEEQEKRDEYLPIVLEDLNAERERRTLWILTLGLVLFLLFLIFRA